MSLQWLAFRTLFFQTPTCTKANRPYILFLYCPSGDLICCLGNALVNGSVILFFVSTRSITTSCLSIISRMKWNHLRMCLDLWWDLGSFAYATAPVLSQYNSTRCCTSGTTFNFMMNFFIQIAFFVASLVACILPQWLVSYGWLLCTLSTHYTTI